MKAICVIIGFKYSDEHLIKGIVLDLFRVYKFAKKAGMDVIVISDIETDNNEDVNRGFSSNYKQKNFHLITTEKYGCDPEIYSFIEDIKESKEYHKYETPVKLQSLVLQHCQNRSRIFFYYTGHAKLDYLLFPYIPHNYTSSKPTFAHQDHEKTDFNTHQVHETIIQHKELIQLKTTDFLHEILLFTNDTNSEMFFMLDCCNTSNLNLPYILNMDFSASKFRSTYYEPGGVYRLCTSAPNYYPQNIVCICSAMNDEVSTSSWTGSMFTELFFQCIELNPKERNLHNVMKEIQHVMRNKQTCRAYASNPSIIYLFPWLFNPNFIKFSYSDTGIYFSLTH